MAAVFMSGRSVLSNSGRRFNVTNNDYWHAVFILEAKHELLIYAHCCRAVRLRNIIVELMCQNQVYDIIKPVRVDVINHQYPKYPHKS